MREPTVSARASCLAVGFAALWLSVPTNAQTRTEPVPQIVVAGSAELVIKPTTAELSIEIKTAAATSAAAATANAQLTKSVLEALKAASLGREEILGTQLSVGPKWNYDESTRRNKRTGIEATNSIQIKTDKLDNIGAYIDAALGAGATGVSNVSFSSTESEVKKRAALAEAVQNARSDAEVIARAGGGKIGALLQISTERPNAMAGVEVEEVVVTAARTEGLANTEVVPRLIVVKATVVAHWQFVPDANSK